MRKICVFLLTLVLTMGANGLQAQTTGYNRLKNVATGHVANLPYKYVFAPNVTEDEACSQPGTVAYMEFGDNQVKQLRAQGTDVVNDLVPMMKVILKQAFSEEYYYALREEMINVVKASYTGAMGNLLVSYMSRYTYEDFQNYIDRMDTNMYYAETEGGYYVYFHSPAFPLDAGDFTEYFTNKVNSYMSAFRGRLQLMVEPFLEGREELKPMINSMIAPLRFADYFYFREIESEDYGTQFGFANSQDYQKEGANDVWTFVPVDTNDRYFGVEGQMQAADGAWYAAFTMGFPYRLAEGMKAYIVEDVVDVDKSEVKWSEVKSDVIPALTPVILRLNAKEAASNKLEMLEDDGGSVIENNALQAATNKHGFLLGRTLEEPDTHYYVLDMEGGKPCLKATEETFLYPNQGFFYLEDSYKQRTTTDYLILSVDVNGVEEIPVTAHTTNQVFDLQGRRVSHPVKGIYIINGKKTVVR